MDNLINKLKVLQTTAVELNDIAEANLQTSKSGLDDIEDEGIKGKLKALSSDFERLKAKKDITGMSELIVQMNKLMNEIK